MHSNVAKVVFTAYKDLVGEKNTKKVSNGSAAKVGKNYDDLTEQLWSMTLMKFSNQRFQKEPEENMQSYH